MSPPPQSVSRVGILVAKGGGEKRRRIRWLVMTGLFGAGFDNKEKYCGKVRETGTRYVFPGLPVFIGASGGIGGRSGMEKS